ncbi:MAG: hypothetical protein ABIZ70_16065 [Gemmatimonadales bacterium]
MTYTFKLSRRIASNHRSILAAAALVLAACGGSSPTSSTPVTPAGPTAGWLTIQITTPRTDDGAVQLSVSGPGVDSARIVGYDGFSVVGNASADMVVTGAIANGTIAQVHLRDISRTSDLRASVSAAAARGSYALQDLTGYRVVVVR